MKKNNAIKSLFLALLILSAIAFQAVHSFNDFEKFKSEICIKKHVSSSKTQISHGHQNVEHCFVCEFTFASAIHFKNDVFQLSKVEIITKYSKSYSKEITQNFKGSLFSLRAPPTFIV